jgi:hypothetical protein
MEPFPSSEVCSGSEKIISEKTRKQRGGRLRTYVPYYTQLAGNSNVGANISRTRSTNTDTTPICILTHTVSSKPD